MIRYKTIMIHEDTHTELKRFGNVTESFDDVIRKLINKAAAGQTLAGNDQTAAAPSKPLEKGLNS